MHRSNYCYLFRRNMWRDPNHFIIIFFWVFSMWFWWLYSSGPWLCVTSFISTDDLSQLLVLRNLTKFFVCLFVHVYFPIKLSYHFKLASSQKVTIDTFPEKWSDLSLGEGHPLKRIYSNSYWINRIGLNIHTFLTELLGTWELVLKKMVITQEVGRVCFFLYTSNPFSFDWHIKRFAYQ